MSSYEIIGRVIVSAVSALFSYVFLWMAVDTAWPLFKAAFGGRP